MDIDNDLEPELEATGQGNTNPSELPGHTVIRPTECGLHCPVEWLLESTYDSDATHLGEETASVGGLQLPPPGYTLHIIVDYCSASGEPRNNTGIPSLSCCP